MVPTYKHALIVGAGPGLSASLARLFSSEGMTVSLAARSIDDLADLCSETGAKAFTCDTTSADDVDALFAALDSDPDVVVYNPSARVRGPFIEIDREATKQAIMVTAYGGFLVAQEAAKRMVPNGHGAILFTGASASVKGYVQSASFAMGKFALRGMAQSMARELHPKGIHIGHFNIDGGIRNINRPERIDAPDNPDSMLDPDAIAQSYLHFLKQDRSSWAWELELRPWVENF
ncbi:MAG: oxidoreductase [Alphaproteobacteria bacterium]|nr:oxidoreductase [Alphaproteobacteria bacterium]|tara:strand:+ start:197 stop:895 length:699 start_codon:yes stop_codon:yes gene_type:complete